MSGSRRAIGVTGVCWTDVYDLIPGPDDLSGTTLDAIAARGLVVAAYL